MAHPMTTAQMKRARVHSGEHEVCYRCDSFEKNYDGTCEICGLTDRISHCVLEWCPYCKKPELSGYYAERCSRRTPNEHDTIRPPMVGPLVYGTREFRFAGSVWTYAILCGEHVKIGKSKDVQRRLDQLQTGAPLPAVILGAVVGDIEREIHARLAAKGVKRTNGEWFEYDNEARGVLVAYGLLTPPER